MFFFSDSHVIAGTGPAGCGRWSFRTPQFSVGFVRLTAGTGHGMLTVSMRGTVTRWGSRGYGFIRPDDSDVEAWVHYRFLADPGWVPRGGERVEFELKELPDGRCQAWGVRPARQSLPPGASAERAPGGGTPSDRPGAGRGSMGTLGEALVRAGHVRVDAGAGRPVEHAVESPVESSAERPAESPADQPAVPTRLDDQLEAHRAAAERASAALRSEVETFRQRIAEMEAKAAQVVLQLEEHQAQALRKEADLIVSAVSNDADEFERVLADRRRLADSLRPVRQQAVAQIGRELVEEYEAIRRRLAADGDCRDELDRRAYQALERERRVGLATLASGMDALDALPVPDARFTLFMGGAAAPGAVFVGPLRGRRSAPGGDMDGATDDVRWRVACVFWQTVERAACELAVGDAATEYGTVAGSMAARLGPCDPELFGVLLDEAWACRPSLESASVDFGFDVVSGVAPPFVPEPPAPADAPPAAQARGVTDGGTVPEVAVRLGLSVRDLLVALQHHGLPPVDDVVDPGAEASLRLLLGGVEQLPLPGGQVEPAAPAPASAAAPQAGTPAIAARLLSKLLRDRRVGGRHTGIEHAYGHHFADEEKKLARRIVEFLEHDGILLTKYNEGAHHVSVNPRRLREVGEIVSGTWTRGDELDRL
ncbi:MAG: cold shock domain-containing protein [Deltaproteobacteria bacterium]|nr:cold shock domain-containing protein [Deltaproteobacteria bacterium]